MQYGKHCINHKTHNTTHAHTQTHTAHYKHLRKIACDIWLKWMKMNLFEELPPIVIMTRVQQKKIWLEKFRPSAVINYRQTYDIGSANVYICELTYTVTHCGAMQIFCLANNIDDLYQCRYRWLSTGCSCTISTVLFVYKFFAIDLLFPSSLHTLHLMCKWRVESVGRRTSGIVNKSVCMWLRKKCRNAIIRLNCSIFIWIT